MGFVYRIKLILTVIMKTISELKELSKHFNF